MIEYNQVNEFIKNKGEQNNGSTEQFIKAE